ncbi:MBL fold metallo-hydrolase [Shewanella glacialipiscicola]|uniref:MBL fold metallo-hydrolase n=1 Tax=Shewanella glacialipiscicola TaxID=614069 RepID=UPI003D790B49
MKILMNKAGNGDCFLITTENTSLLIDGGIASTYPKWSSSLDNIKILDALIITHIDNDHTNGIIKFIDDLRFGKNEISNVFFNGIKQITRFKESISCEYSADYDAIASNFSPDIESEAEIGFSEGTSLSYLLESKGLKINELNNENAIHNLSFEAPICIKDISIQFIGPCFNSLKKLNQSWSEILNERGIKRRVLNKKHAIAFENFVSSLSTRENGESNISYNSKISIEELCNRAYERDTSISNESSFSFILRNGEKSILMLGDSHIETVINWLDLSNIEKLHIDAIKISHHGSKHNINSDFLNRVYCNNYLISTNGKKHNHPDLESLALIAMHSTKPDTNIYINYKIERIPSQLIQKLGQLSNPTKIHFETSEVLL